jgi:hypothetical protein
MNAIIKAVNDRKNGLVRTKEDRKNTYKIALDMYNKKRIELGLKPVNSL